MDVNWFKNKILPGLLTLAIINAVYAYSDVKELNKRVNDLESMFSNVKDIKKLMCLLALDTDKKKLKEQICADLLAQ